MSQRNYIFLDTEREREQLISQIASVRQAVLGMTETIPKDQWYEPRFHEWSLAAILGHLHLSDNLCIWNIQLAMLGISPPIPSTTWDGLNNFMARVFRQRVVETTMRGIQKNEKRIAEFILRMPVEKFTRQVYDPPINKYLTIEQALQEFFLFHWQDHLKTMQQSEGIYHEPPENPDMVV